ncbi:gamma-glutamylcyclotransferase family protein [Clostridium sp. DL1XJH146]
MKVEKRLNIAYGSNLNLKQMAYRCPTAKVYGKGILKGYRLLFKGAPGNAYATIEKRRGGKVPVLVWELQPDDEWALDFYEGYPRFYEKEEVDITLESGETVTAMVYIMTDKLIERIHINLPSHRYLKIVEAGYEMAGFDKKVIEKALEISEKEIKKHPPKIL